MKGRLLSIDAPGMLGEVDGLRPAFGRLDPADDRAALAADRDLRRRAGRRGPARRATRHHTVAVRRVAAGDAQVVGSGSPSRKRSGLPRRWSPSGRRRCCSASWSRPGCMPLSSSGWLAIGAVADEVAALDPGVRPGLDLGRVVERVLARVGVSSRRPGSGPPTASRAAGSGSVPSGPVRISRPPPPGVDGAVLRFRSSLSWVL